MVKINYDIIKDNLSDIENMYILETGRRTIKFRFTPAISENKPLLIILHGQGYALQPSKFISPNWNVLCPMDNFGYDSLGSWFLGENGDFFWIDIIKYLISWVKERMGHNRLYFWGSSMGGYGAIIHGRLNNARSIYANTPQTLLLGSRYSEYGSKKYFDAIFGEGKIYEDYNDLCSLIKTRSSTKYFLCFNQLEGSNYFTEQGLRFITHLQSLRNKMYIEVRPYEVHAKNHSISEAIELFKKFD